AMARIVNGVPLTGNGAVTGDPRYLSPEQVKGSTLDSRSDLYSFAVVLYEMLCGRPPFDSKSQFELMLAHVNQAPEPPSAFVPSLPRTLDDVLLKALAKDPADRYATATEFGSAMAGIVVPAGSDVELEYTAEGLLFSEADAVVLASVDSAGESATIVEQD